VAKARSAEMDFKPHIDRAKNLLAEIRADIKVFLAWSNVKLKQFSGWLGNNLVAYSGNTEPAEQSTDDYYTKWREEKEKRVRLEAELAEEKRNH
jgi:hypothetical protein